MKPILEHLVVAVFLVMIIGYMIAAEIKQRRLEQYIEDQRNKKVEACQAGRHQGLLRETSGN